MRFRKRIGGAPDGVLVSPAGKGSVSLGAPASRRHGGSKAILADAGIKETRRAEMALRAVRAEITKDEDADAEQDPAGAGTTQGTASRSRPFS